MKNRRGETVQRRHAERTVSSRRTVSDPLITLLTDFGNADYFVAALKGVILSTHPQAQIVDITHDIPPHDIEAGAFTLLAACSSFPEGTINVAVVDPTVGSSRRAILIQVRNQFFVGPDNGIFSYVCDGAEQSPEVFHLTNDKYFRQPVSPTFNGRDVFAPVAAALANGVTPAELGVNVSEFVRLPALAPTVLKDGRIGARIIHIDRFGNCVTNITPNELTEEMIAAGAKLRLKGKLVKSFRKFFAEEAGSRDKIFGVWGSAGFLEIVATNQSAAKLLNVKRGDAVMVRGT